MSKPYYTISDIDYEGRRAVTERLHGIDKIKSFCTDRTVLDLGCAEGAISRELAKWGARLVHGVDRYEDRLLVASQIFSDLNLPHELTYSFYRGDFQDIASFLNQSSEKMLATYDIVILLGILHDVEQDEAIDFLRHILPLCDEWLLIRGSLNRHKSVQRIIEKDGLELCHSVLPPECLKVGHLCVYRKRP